jgi:hypothetical protein
LIPIDKLKMRKTKFTLKDEEEQQRQQFYKNLGTGKIVILDANSG